MNYPHNLYVYPLWTVVSNYHWAGKQQTSYVIVPSVWPRGSLKLTVPSSRSKRYLHLASIRLCLALLFIISIIGLPNLLFFAVPAVLWAGGQTHSHFALPSSRLSQFTQCCTLLFEKLAALRPVPQWSQVKNSYLLFYGKNTTGGSAGLLKVNCDCWFIRSFISWKPHKTSHFYFDKQSSFVLKKSVTKIKHEKIWNVVKASLV